MPKKPSKYGIKFNNIVDVRTSYLLYTQIYLGKSNSTDKKAINLAEKVLNSKDLNLRKLI